MGQFSEIFALAEMAIMFVSSFMMAIFTFSLYFLNKKRKSLLILSLADLILFFISILFFFEYFTRVSNLIQWASAISLVLVTLWVEAIFNILDIKRQKLQFSIANIVNLIITIILAIFVHHGYLVYAVTPIFVSYISTCGALQIYFARGEVKKKDAIFTMSVFGMYAVFNLFVGIYRFIVPMDASSFGNLDFIALFFFAVSLALAHIINLTVLYLNFSSLTNKLEVLNSIDMLTGVYSRRVFFELLNRKLASLRRGGSNLGVTLLDIDGFKRINDIYGHSEGDRVLKLFATKLKSCLRENDLIGRIGGEEFVLVLETPSEEEGRLALMRIKDGMRDCCFIEGEQITFSAGYVFIDKQSPQMTETEIIQITDRRMYEAKALGKDRIV